MGKVLIGIGIAFIVVGLLWQFGVFEKIPLGRLPGDIVIENENSKFYFPIVTSILVSVVLSGVMYLLQKLF